MNKFLYFIVLVLFNSTAYSQYCGSDDFFNLYETETEETYRRIDSWIFERNDVEYILPVVIHVIHQSGPENISLAQIEQGIKWLNDAFSNQGVYQNNNGVNTKIQFCLAKRSESGHATDGVNRIYSPLTNYNFNGIDKDLKNLSRWEPLSYINIWLVNSLSWYGNASIAGYAYPPSVAGSQLDGMVLESEYFGKDKSLTVPLIHEMGHYLGLLHTFNGGCKNDNCLIDGDKVCDTPPDGVNIAISCNGSFKVNSCYTDEDDNSINNPFRDIGLGGIGDQVDLEDNFMDYGFYSCAVNFTAGQTQRMRFYLEEKRSGLTYSRGCLEPCNELIVASFQTDKNQYNAGDTILITNNCTGASKFYWLLNGQFVSSDSSPKIIAFGNGPSILELLVWNDNVNCDSVSVSAIINIDCVTRAFIENTISDGKLIVKSKSVFFDSIYTKIEKQDSIFYSTNKELDSIQLENGVFLITHIAFGHGCNDTIRVVFEINNIISEICDNDKDDDLDGFVDGYDDNCECNNNHFNGGCISNCEFIDSIYPIKMRQKWSTDILHDLEFNLSQFLIFDSLIINPFSLGSLDTSYHGFDLINAKNGVKIKRIISDTLINNFYWGRYFAITKIENSDLFYILYPTQDNRIILSDLSNNIIWSSKRYFNFYERPNYLKITDFNGDGSLEFYYGNRIFNFASGQLLFNGHESMGCISYPFKIAAPKLYEQCGWGAFSVAADLTSHQGLELAAGNVVYEVDLINLSDTINNTFEVKFAPSQVLDGATAVADVNSDGLLDVIVNRGAKNSESGGLWVWDPRTMEIIAEVIFPQLSLSHQPGYMNGGIPIIANVDDDCFPEIIVSFVNEIRIYKYTGGQNLNLLYSKPISDFSGVISASIFDLNWDNINELIIRDERYLRILNARTGTTIDSFEIHSGTLTEQPIIADIDNDRNAEILVSGYLPFEKDAQRIFCFESANLPWAPARSVWNQAGYHITNVNDDLTIPRQPQNNAAFFDTDSCAQTTCPQPYNTFMCQATYRTQDGCVKWPAVDLSVDALSYRCEPDSLYLTLVVRNQSDNALKKDSLALGIYEQGQEAPFHNQWIHLPKDASGQIVNADTITLAIANDRPNRTGLRFRINILDPSTTFYQNIKGLTAVLECDYGNNTDSLEIVPCVFFEICNDSLFNNQCPTTCVYSSDSLSHLELELKWKSEAVSPAKGVNYLYSNILSDSYGKLYTIYTANYSGKAISGVMTLEGKTGKLLEKSIPDTTIYTYPSQLLMFLNENDLNLIRYSYGLRNENANGGLNWFNDRYNGSAIYRTADLNEDGKTEIYGGDKIYNSQNGKIIFDGISSEGCNSWTLSPGNLCSAASNTIVADFTDSPGLELACGNIVYEFSSYTDDTCMASSILAPFGVKDGFTATADINLDGQLDVVVVSSQVDGGKLWVWDPRTKKMIAEADSGIGGSLPAIANVDDDCYPEIVISYYNKVVVYKFDETTVLKELTEFPKEDNSGCTGISMFDFDQDGKHEIIFRDIKRLVIADGENGIVLGQVSINSGTAQEYPVIADIDGDNQAEILINGFEDSDPDSIRIFCFESANLPWAPARSVWNQAGYHITNVNDDLTIPRQPQNNA
ncbi:MAG TPA: M43 family zinc metalloprotease, partial [Saprospiraceae bacterium]|nr:M43 family zinc metalloprotease [Saprospiraceae bacterium]